MVEIAGNRWESADRKPGNRRMGSRLLNLGQKHPKYLRIVTSHPKFSQFLTSAPATVRTLPLAKKLFFRGLSVSVFSSNVFGRAPASHRRFPASSISGPWPSNEPSSAFPAFHLTILSGSFHTASRGAPFPPLPAVRRPRPEFAAAILKMPRASGRLSP